MTPPPDRPDRLTVACLCAAWCGTCRDYRATFAGAAAAHPDVRFAWIDIEDEADALGDEALDIETFPCLLVLRGVQVLFHGALTPHPAALERLVRDLSAPGDGRPRGDAARVPAAMAAAVAALAPARAVTGPATG